MFQSLDIKSCAAKSLKHDNIDNLLKCPKKEHTARIIYDFLALYKPEIYM